MTKKNSIGPFVFTTSVCLLVCLFVYVLSTGHSFCRRKLILAWGTLEWIPKTVFFSCFFEILRFDLFMAIFRPFGSVFAIHPSFILKESVDQAKFNRDLKFGIWDLYMLINWSQMFFNNLKITSGFLSKP